ncbi:iron-containing alcohol dehydrogenase [Leptotrichia sp. OH3620_COT-345]|uniref:iron-containing alcohol dehydrogenase n=1 Tax=Leptotrichia sp. OH3620_COT-345 TaxID=2491048 RepID=UPI0018F5CD78|nr:iron-containing alcohol dehydrogenase [Leptotrichia sp. OH3620_COT-345]
MINNFIYRNPTKILFGKGQIKHLSKEISTYGKKILLLYGGGSIKKNGLYDEIYSQLKDFEIFELGGVEPNPRVSTARKAIEIIRKNNIDFLLAAGGGSTVDCAKLISVGTYYDGDPWDIVKKKYFPEKALPFGDILTLAATGSEMNPGSVITNIETEEKIGWSSPLAYPKFSILDPVYTFTVPLSQTVNGIVDTMSHMIEQYFNAEHNPVMDGLIESSLKTVMKYAPLVLESPHNYDIRAVLMMSATIGLNYSLSWGTMGDWATHGIEHAVSAVYDIAHAEGLSIIMPNWLLYILPKDILRVKQFAINVMDVNPEEKSDEEIGKEGILKLQSYWKSLGAPTHLSEVGIDSTNIKKMAEIATDRPVLGSVYNLTKNDVINILKSSL